MIVTKPLVKKNNTGDCWGCLGGGVPEGIRNVSKGTDYPLTAPPKSVECEVCASDDISTWRPFIPSILQHVQTLI
jgi:hypothetical protein